MSVTGGYDHTRPGTPTAPSSVCAALSSPSHAGRGYEANLLKETPSGSGSFSQLRQATGILDMTGREDVSFGIDQGGSNVRYQIDVAVITSSGAQVTGTTGPIATPVSPEKSRDCLAPHN